MRAAAFWVRELRRNVIPEAVMWLGMRRLSFDERDEFDRHPV
ncbi:hypothetical protein Plim_4124 [Planctopirus limnophila DSM 3776]|uniref:Uncharacterized protein n=1 Tax=Planctopirus limnophila (strain ATCC 43296 / DSM 3776 / IFAM 1008 / Mu 290) TaxID=521674 RepID=D5SZ34_PLAL2|nr:hypothetical protein [Planctopirus limnophila]ADG69935.1 hypothetical protein Plim_4124 [Planctopirus limnophila DSM 3776]